LLEKIVPHFEGYSIIVQHITCLLTQESTAEALPGTICSSEEKTPFTSSLPGGWIGWVRVSGLATGEGCSCAYWHFAKSVKVTEDLYVEIKKRRNLFDSKRTIES